MKEFSVNRATTALAVFAALLPLVTLPAAAASTVVLPSPATVLTLSPVAGYIQDTLEGAMCASPNTCAPVDYLPFWTTAGTSAINAAIDLAATADPNGEDAQIVVFGYSNGAQVVAQWLTEHGDDPAAPSADKLSFVLIGNATRAYGGANVTAGETMPQTKYKVIDISREYDLASDVPNGPFNVLAGANALAGLFVLHDYRAVDIHDPANSVWTVGNTTYVFVPTKNLPLLEPLRWVGLSALADQLNGPLKALVEQGYDRSYLPPPTPPTPPTPPDPTPPDPSTDPTPSAPALAAKSASSRVPVVTGQLTPSSPSADPGPAEKASIEQTPVEPDVQGQSGASTPPFDETDDSKPAKTSQSPAKTSGADDGAAAKLPATSIGHTTTSSSTPSTKVGNKVESATTAGAGSATPSSGDRNPTNSGSRDTSGDGHESGADSAG